jgi:hypothetical protein
MNQVAGDTASVFAEDIIRVNASEARNQGRWQLGQTVAFAVTVSAALWAMIAGFVYFI